MPSTLGRWVCVEIKDLPFEKSSYFCGFPFFLFFFLACSSTNNQFVKRTSTCISILYSSLYSDRFLPLIYSLVWSSITLTSKRKRQEVPSRCSWQKIRRNITTLWKRWVARNHLKPFHVQGYVHSSTYSHYSSINFVFSNLWFKNLEIRNWS